MKKISLLIVLLSFTVASVFCQDLTKAKRLETGDLTLLEETLSDIDLAGMDNNQLRILRNMVYAKYGHKFNSSELKSFYSKFEWYKPSKKVDDMDLTDNERKLVQRITVFEARNTTAHFLEYGDEIIGIWHNTPVMPSTWGDRFVIYPDNKIDFLVSNFEETAEIREYCGSYTVKGNTLIFTVQKLKKNGEYVTLEDPYTLEFPVTAVSEVSFADGKLIRQMIKIGSYEYFLYDNNPETIGTKSRK